MEDRSEDPDLRIVEVSLYLDTQGEFALPARDYRVEASVSGWYVYDTGSSSHAWLHPVAQLVTPAGLHNHRLRILIGWKPALRGFMQRGPRSQLVSFVRAFRESVRAGVSDAPVGLEGRTYCCLLSE